MIPRFCAKLHAVSTEKKPMSKKILMIFPSKTTTKSKQNTELKSKEKVIDVLAAGIVKLSAAGVKSDVKIQDVQIGSMPGLLADTEEKLYRKEYKTNLRKAFEKEYKNSFEKPSIIHKNTAYIRDSMQDITLCPLRHHIKFSDYFDLYWELKIKSSFSVATTVIIDFDCQHRLEHAPKDIIRNIRDTKGTKDKKEKVMQEIPVSDDDLTPSHELDMEFFLEKSRE